VKLSVYQGLSVFGLRAVVRKPSGITDYSINGEEEVCVYALANGDVPKIGKLGKCRIQLFPGENNIVFTVKDSLGQIGEYVVHERLVFKLWRGIPPYDNDKWKPLKGGGEFLENRIIVIVGYDTPYAIIARAANAVNGSITGRTTIPKYYIEVPDSTEDELIAMCKLLMSEYDIEFAYFDYLLELDL
jgi:hypothetical protein